MPMPCEDHWRSRVVSTPFRAAVSFDGDDLVLGSRTVLYKLGAVASGTISLRPDAAHDRMVALLAVAGRGRVAKAALAQLAVALDEWRRGDRGLAAIRLVFAPLPRLRDRDDAYRLFLAETALDTGLSPNELLKALGYSACTALLKFDPNQPRVPAGSGARSGQWTSGGTGGGASGTVSRPTSIKPPRDSQAGLRPTPVLFSESPEDKERTSPEEEDRRLGIGGDEKERVEEGQPLLPPTIAPGAPVSPPRPAVPDGGTSGPATCSSSSRAISGSCFIQIRRPISIFFDRLKVKTQGWRLRAWGERYTTAFQVRLTQNRQISCYTTTFLTVAF